MYLPDQSKYRIERYSPHKRRQVQGELSLACLSEALVDTYLSSSRYEYAIYSHPQNHENISISDA